MTPSWPQRYEDAIQFKNIMAPLVTLEAENDRRMKESQKKFGFDVRWEMGIHGKYIAYFMYPKEDSGMVLNHNHNHTHARVQSYIM
jgi:regulator of nonsense transcripts 1